MDIELRWHQRPAMNEKGDNYFERVLQYRSRVMNMGNGYRQVGAGDGNTYVAEYQRPMGWTWSEWTDVPVSSGDREP